MRREVRDAGRRHRAHHEIFLGMGPRYRLNM